jgi:hypothetical protein
MSYCDCEPSFYGDRCQMQVPNCHLNCGGDENCNPQNDPNFCTNCKSGYALDRGICKRCNKSCETCDIGNQNFCSTCYDGYFADHGECRACSFSCLLCTGADTRCLACYENSVLENFTCVCQSPLVRNPTTAKCGENCPSGFVADSQTRICEQISVALPAVSFDFT